MPGLKKFANFLLTYVDGRYPNHTRTVLGTYGKMKSWGTHRGEGAADERDVQKRANKRIKGLEYPGTRGVARCCEKNYTNTE